MITLSTHVFPWEVLGERGRYGLSCFEISLENKQVSIAATNGKALVVVRVPDERADIKPFLVPSESLREVIKSVEKGQVLIETSRATLQPKRGAKREVVWNEAELGHFPPWRDMNMASKPERVRIHLDLETLGLAAKTLDQLPAKIEFTEQGLNLTAKRGPLTIRMSLDGRIEESKTPKEAGFNFSLLYDAAVAVCRPVGVSDCTIVFRDDDEAASVYAGPGERTTTYGLVMPVYLA